MVYFYNNNKKNTMGCNGWIIFAIKYCISSSGNGTTISIDWNAQGIVKSFCWYLKCDGIVPHGAKSAC